MNEVEEYLLCIPHIKKETVRCGPNLRKPTDGSICSVIIEIVYGTIPNEARFVKPTALTVTIGNGDELLEKVIEYCLTTMSEGEESLFYIPAVSFCVRCRFTLENCLFKSYIFQMPDSQKYTIAQEYKHRGVQLYQEKKVVQAFEKFKKALKYILVMKINYPPEEPPLPDDNFEKLDLNEVDAFRVTIYNNLAMCQLHNKSYVSVVPLCTKSLMISPNVKAYYRRALAFIEIVEYENAENDLINLLKIETDNKAALEKLAFVRKLDKSNRETYKETIKKMFL